MQQGSLGSGIKLLVDHSKLSKRLKLPERFLAVATKYEKDTDPARRGQRINTYKKVGAIVDALPSVTVFFNEK